MSVFGKIYCMKKVLFGILLFFCGNLVFSQNQQIENTLFAQCMIEVNSSDEMKTLESEMRANPYIKIIRLDYQTQRAFLLTQNIEELSEENLKSWFSSYADNVRCVQIGKHGIDTVNPYPFVGCSKE